MMNQSEQLRTLTVDIGGSGIKVMVLDPQGQPLSDRQRLKTPDPAKPKQVIDTILTLAQTQEFDRVSVGFPGVVQHGLMLLAKPVKVANDADIQGFGAISGKGVELVVTLGTGFGSALFVDGKLVPNLEMGHHPFRKKETYEQQLGRAALEREGQKKWNDRLAKALANLERLFNYERLYIGGGETKNINFTLPDNATVIPNITGLLGGIKLWTN